MSDIWLKINKLLHPILFSLFLEHLIITQSSMLSKMIQDFVEKQAKDAISEKIGISPDILEKVDTDMIGSLIGGLTGNAKKGDANNIITALQKDHDGSGLNDIIGLIWGSDKDGWGILKHILGSQQKTVEAYIVKKYNLDPKMVSSLMTTLAPIVMSYLGKEAKEKSMDATQLTQYLKKEEKEILEDPSNNTNPLISFLDKDGDGDIDLIDFLS